MAKLTEQDLFERVRAVVAQSLKIEDLERIQVGTLLADDLRADSLDFVDLSIALEEEFEKDAPGGELGLEEDDWVRVTGKPSGYTVADIISVLRNKGVGG